MVGSLEVLGAIALLVPLLAGLAAACLFVLMIGAVSVELFVVDGGSVSTGALICLVVVAVVAVLRRDTIVAPFSFVHGLVRERPAGGGATAVGPDNSSRS